ncbi:b5 reductase 4 [Seminavis robusta]|uniref:B5 reductase 4 n=1 Tax=Seminavis robusta TaxID=568900 RepID=A0A9N8ETM5_9STRA|nr:b5 reductase 4 [Seminavis robusta]|eukprot:Sro1653_g288850.1 b5 reductase 4 (211) ;mRNA; f:15788-16555
MSSNEDDDRIMNDTTMPPPKMKASNGIQKNPPRRKFGLRKGFGLGDWVQLTKSAKDLAQLKGAPLRNITKSELRQHCEVYDGWCALKGKVYNIGPYLPYHPGGEAILKKVLGKDGTALFDKYHRWVNIDGLIGKLQVGYLVPDPEKEEGTMKPPAYMATTAKEHEFAVPAPVVKKGTARNVNNVLPKPPERDEDQVEEDYTEPWDEQPKS